MRFNTLRSLVIAAVALGATVAFADPVTFPSISSTPSFDAWDAGFHDGFDHGFKAFDEHKFEAIDFCKPVEPAPYKFTSDPGSFCLPPSPVSCPPPASPAPKTCVPEPCSMAILGVGLAGVLARRKKNA